MPWIILPSGSDLPPDALSEQVALRESLKDAVKSATTSVALYDAVMTLLCASPYTGFETLVDAELRDLKRAEFNAADNRLLFTFNGARCKGAVLDRKRAALGAFFAAVRCAANQPPSEDAVDQLVRLAGTSGLPGGQDDGRRTTLVSDIKRMADDMGRCHVGFPNWNELVELAAGTLPLNADPDAAIAAHDQLINRVLELNNDLPRAARQTLTSSVVETRIGAILQSPARERLEQLLREEKGRYAAANEEKEAEDDLGALARRIDVAWPAYRRWSEEVRRAVGLQELEEALAASFDATVLALARLSSLIDEAETLFSLLVRPPLQRADGAPLCVDGKPVFGSLSPYVFCRLADYQTFMFMNLGQCVTGRDQHGPTIRPPLTERSRRIGGEPIDWPVFDFEFSETGPGNPFYRPLLSTFVDGLTCGIQFYNCSPVLYLEDSSPPPTVWVPGAGSLIPKPVAKIKDEHDVPARVSFKVPGDGSFIPKPVAKIKDEHDVPAGVSFNLTRRYVPVYEFSGNLDEPVVAARVVAQMAVGFGGGEGRADAVELENYCWSFIGNMDSRRWPILREIVRARRSDLADLPGTLEELLGGFVGLDKRRMLPRLGAAASTRISRPLDLGGTNRIWYETVAFLDNEYVLCQTPYLPSPGLPSSSAAYAPSGGEGEEKAREGDGATGLPSSSDTSVPPSMEDEGEEKRREPARAGGSEEGNGGQPQMEDETMGKKKKKELAPGLAEALQAFRFRYFRRVRRSRLNLDAPAPRDELMTRKVLKITANNRPHAADVLQDDRDRREEQRGDGKKIATRVTFGVSLPVVLNIDENYAAFRQEKGQLRAIKAKGDLLRKNRAKRRNGNAVMAAIIRSMRHPGWIPPDTGSSLSADVFASAIMMNSAELLKDWQTLKATELRRPPSGQEWCHLHGHGDGGDERVPNFVLGSAHCNTEQLAIESAHREITQSAGARYILHSTAYLFRDDSMDEKLNYLGPAPVQTGSGSMRADQDTIRRRAEERKDASKNAPVAKFIRYKIFDGRTSSKVFDHTFEAQSEFFDINQYRILYRTVQIMLDWDGFVRDWRLHVANEFKPAPPAHNPGVNEERMGERVLNVRKRPPGDRTEKVSEIKRTKGDGEEKPMEPDGGDDVEERPRGDMPVKEPGDVATPPMEDERGAGGTEERRDDGSMDMEDPPEGGGRMDR